MKVIIKNFDLTKVLKISVIGAIVVVLLGSFVLGFVRGYNAVHDDYVVDTTTVQTVNVD